MEYMNELDTAENGETRILCCECGDAIEPNPSNMCVLCLRGKIDITEGIPKQGTLYFCRGCERYLQPPADWIPCALESRELLSLCLKKLKGLNRVKLVDAGFVWTEPHSKRIKVKLTVHAEVLGGTILQQVFVVEFTVNHHMCDECHRSEAQDFWRAQVQVRQKVLYFSDYNEFLDDLEEDPAYRQNVNIFRNADIPVDTDDLDDPNAPRITLEEMMNDMDLEDVEMGE